MQAYININTHAQNHHTFESTASRPSHVPNPSLRETASNGNSSRSIGHKLSENQLTARCGWLYGGACYVVLRKGFHVILSAIYRNTSRCVAFLPIRESAPIDAYISIYHYINDLCTVLYLRRCNTHGAQYLLCESSRDILVSSRRAFGKRGAGRRVGVLRSIVRTCVQEDTKITKASVSAVRPERLFAVWYRLYVLTFEFCVHQNAQCSESAPRSFA
ncbi:hypothetical protein EVAR_43067_1 [Eumeta japonica]|uniref:Uncharacterized protein n=1 Tax=Eumeta variegata TaxID=151549 RepID=A0A4C1WWM7_EUMVA|nr:hypothetical protein EVAR_43067_1 [Eumeta japonica]